MPAEWEPHAATWLAWPHYHGDWPGKFEPIPWVYAEIIRNLAKHERVELIVNNASAPDKRARRCWSERMPSPPTFDFIAGPRTAFGCAIPAASFVTRAAGRSSGYRRPRQRAELGGPQQAAGPQVPL